LHATLDPASIDTGHARRDSDLRGKRFLAVDSYPLMEVIADRIAATVDGWHADGVLRGHGYEAPVCIDATLEGAATAPRLQVSGTARLDLRDVCIRVPGFLVRRFIRPVSFGAAHAAGVSTSMSSDPGFDSGSAAATRFESRLPQQTTRSRGQRPSSFRVCVQQELSRKDALAFWCARPSDTVLSYMCDRFRLGRSPSSLLGYRSAAG
jgi:YceI-like protein